MTHIVFHIEGGISNSQSSDMRKAFRRFFSEIDLLANGKGGRIDFFMHGSRLSAYKGFRGALTTQPGKYHVLLVDSEDAVRDRDECWRHLRERQADGWARPASAEDAQCQLMVQAVEAWLFADPETLQAYYGPGFNVGILPARQNVEEISKSEHIGKLEAASRQTKKGLYHKTRHLPDLLGRIDAAKVRQRAWHCDHIFVTLSKKLGTELPPLCVLRPDP